MTKKYPADVLGEYEDIAFSNEEYFLNYFGYKYHQLAQISFSREQVRITIVADCGQHLGDSISVEDYKEWLDTFIIDWED